MQATKSVTKPAAKAKAKSAFSLVAYVVAEVDKRVKAEGFTFYSTALSYHKGRKTVFPRSDAYKSLTKEAVDKVLDKHDKHVLASGHADGQAVFDMYMLNRKA